MRIRGYVHAALALVSLLPAEAFAGVPVVQASVSAPPGDVIAGSTVQIGCDATGASGMLGSTTVQAIQVTVSGGTASPTDFTCTTGAGTCTVASSWTTPGAPGIVTATCTATIKNPFGALSTIASSASITTVAGASLPPAVSAIVGASDVMAGSTSTFSVTATDSNVPPRPLTYAWSVTGGTLTPDAVNPAVASWAAPATPGPYTLTVTVSNGGAPVSTSTVVNVGLANYQASLGASFVAPRRISIADDGNMAIVARQPTDSGEVALVTARGEMRGLATLPEPVLAVAYGGGVLWATTSRGSLFKIDPSTGRTIAKVTLADGPLHRSAIALAYDPVGMAIWIVESDLLRIRVVRPDGARVAFVTDAGGYGLNGMIDIAFDSAAGRAWVLFMNPYPESQLPSALPIAAARFVHSYDRSFVYAGSYLSVGGGAGQLTRAGGLAVGPDGRKYITDSFQGVIQAYAPDLSPLATIGAWGTGEGHLFAPGAVAVMASNDLAVVSGWNILRFGTGAPLPTCAGDSDCDGLPDAWEIAHGLNPNWAGDALLDYDGDGLNNAEEYAHGTDPRNRDTDGDGFSDGWEVAMGYDPLNGSDHAPAVSVSGPAHTPPGLVRLSSVIAGTGNCTIGWSQPTTGTLKATLSSTTSASPTFVARTAGSYAFDATARCGGVASAPGRVTVTVDNVPPRADAGRVVVAAPGRGVLLDATASSDANGDPLTFTWDETLGSPIDGAESGSTIFREARRPGLYAFQVTVSDSAGNQGTAEVPVLVAGPGTAPTAIARAVPATANVGDSVALDASASVVGGDGAYTWQQVAGPDLGKLGAEISGASERVASFSPPAPGRYAFEVAVASGSLRSPAARVEVYVADTGGTLPTVTATAPSIVAMSAPVALEATASGGTVYAWRQVSGPAAGLTDADAATATAVPFAPGFYVFEVKVRDAAGAESRPFSVAFEARDRGAAIPQARVTAQPTAIVNDRVLLDGRASTGATRYRWSQVGGPWVAIESQTAVTSFKPHDPGVYAFELQVDDGTTRSAPASVEINVSAGGVQ